MHYHSKRALVSGCAGRQLFPNLPGSENRLLYRGAFRGEKGNIVGDIGSGAIRHYIQQHRIAEDKDVEGLDMGDCYFDIFDCAGFRVVDAVEEVREGGEGHQQGKPYILFCEFSTHRLVQLHCESGDSRVLKQNGNALNSVRLLLFGYVQARHPLPHQHAHHHLLLQPRHLLPHQ